MMSSLKIIKGKLTIKCNGQILNDRSQTKLVYHKQRLILGLLILEHFFEYENI